METKSDIILIFVLIAFVIFLVWAIIFNNEREEKRRTECIERMESYISSNEDLYFLCKHLPK